MNFLKKIIYLTLILFPFICSAQIQLNWQMIHAQTGEVMPIGEKGLVQEALFNNGFLPDPFYSDNEKQYLWVEDYEWEFFSDFEVKLDTIQGEKIELEFPTIDTYAKIFVNGVMVGESDNCFHPFSYFIQDLLKDGKNTVKIIFTPPVIHWKEKYENAEYILPAPNDVGEMAVSPYCRKPQYQFGWDWTLRMNTMGIWKPVSIFSYDDSRFLSTQVETTSISDTSAELKVNLFFTDTLDENRLICSRFLGDYVLEKGRMFYSFSAQIKNPNLWWPKELGIPFLYDDILIVKDEWGNIEFRDTFKFGIRKTELRRPNDQWGQGYEIYINNVPYFCKGANLIPQDIFPTRIDKSAIDKLVFDALKSNINMLRVWGGGYYPDDYFYRLCDEKGILIWQDFMFACAFYKADSSFIEQIGNELSFQIPRISAHPSVALFNGNNEIEVAWKNWGLQESYKLSESAQDQIWKDYQFIFQDYIPNLKNHFSSIPYIHTSPLSNWGKLSDFDFGSQHYWGLWHGNDSLIEIENKIGRFNSEYGFQSFPEFSTLNSFCDSSDWYLESNSIKSHQKSYVGSQKIALYVDQIFGKTDDFKTFVYHSQLTQAEIIGRSITAHRLNFPRCMGTLYWQFNDCWPAPTWSGIDYFGNWKAVQYQVQKDFQQITVLRQETENKPNYYLTITNGFLTNVHLNYVCKDLNGKIISKGTFDIDTLISNVNLNDHIKIVYNKPSILILSWSSDYGSGSREFLENFNSFENNNAKVQLKLKHIDKKNGRAKLIIKNNLFVPYLWVFSKFGGVSFDENFICLLPGRHNLNITFETLPSADDFGCIWWQKEKLSNK